MVVKELIAGDNIPDNINVLIEIPAHSDPVKYEVDKKTNMLFVDRFITTAMYYPCNYGYVPNTLSDDGDPVDVLVLTPYPLVRGAVIQCRCVGVLVMEDEKGQDNKIIAVPIDSVSTLYQAIETFEDLPKDLLSRISHFFEHYKDLESTKWVKVKGWFGVNEARDEIIESIKRFEKSEKT